MKHVQPPHDAASLDKTRRPALPHEQGESRSSQAGGSPQQRDQGRQALRNATDGTADTRIKDTVTGKNIIKPVKQLGTGGSFDLPANVTGDWDLTLYLTPKGNRYDGTAVVQILPGGAVTNFIATGNYSPATSTSNITLKDTGLNLNLVIATSGSTTTIHSLKGKIYGQTLNYQAP